MHLFFFLEQAKEESISTESARHHEESLSSQQGVKSTSQTNKTALEIHLNVLYQKVAFNA